MFDSVKAGLEMVVKNSYGFWLVHKWTAKGVLRHEKDSGL